MEGVYIAEVKISFKLIPEVPIGGSLRDRLRSTDISQ